jgi:hypothetical protein
MSSYFESIEVFRVSYPLDHTHLPIDRVDIHSIPKSVIHLELAFRNSFEILLQLEEFLDKLPQQTYDTNQNQQPDQSPIFPNLRSLIFKRDSTWFNDVLQASDIYPSSPPKPMRVYFLPLYRLEHLELLWKRYYVLPPNLVSYISPCDSLNLMPRNLQSLRLTTSTLARPPDERKAAGLASSLLSSMFQTLGSFFFNSKATTIQYREGFAEEEAELADLSAMVPSKHRIHSELVSLLCQTLPQSLTKLEISVSCAFISDSMPEALPSTLVWLKWRHLQPLSVWKPLRFPPHLTYLHFRLYNDHYIVLPVTTEHLILPRNLETLIIRYPFLADLSFFQQLPRKLTHLKASSHQLLSCAHIISRGELPESLTCLKLLRLGGEISTFINEPFALSPLMTLSKFDVHVEMRAADWNHPALQSLVSARVVAGPSTGDATWLSLPRSITSLEITKLGITIPVRLANLPRKLTTLSCQPAARMDLLADCPCPPLLTSLTLSSGIESFNVQCLGKLPKSLTYLSMGPFPAICNPQDLEDFAVHLPPNLRHLRFFGSLTFVSDQDIANLPRSLINIELQGAYQLTPQCIPNLPPFLCFAGLPRLVLRKENRAGFPPFVCYPADSFLLKDSSKCIRLSIKDYRGCSVLQHT